MLFLFLLFCLDCKVWTRAKINYPFIFEFDPRHSLDWHQLSEVRLKTLNIYVDIFSLMGIVTMCATLPVGSLCLAQLPTGWNQFDVPLLASDSNRAFCHDHVLSWPDTVSQKPRVVAVL